MNRLCTQHASWIDSMLTIEFSSLCVTARQSATDFEPRRPRSCGSTTSVTESFEIISATFGKANCPVIAMVIKLRHHLYLCSRPAISMDRQRTKQAGAAAIT